MKAFLAWALVAAIGLGAAPASAFTLSPPGTEFQAGGPVYFFLPSTSYECTVSLHGVTKKKGAAQIDSVAITPNTTDCANTSVNGLSWKVKADSATRAKIRGLAFVTPFGLCGPANTSVSIDARGVWSINAPVPSSCARVQAYLPTSPAIVIVP